MGDISGALSAYMAASLSWIAAETKDAQRWGRSATVIILSNLGLAQWQQGDLGGALTSFRRALTARSIRTGCSNAGANGIHWQERRCWRRSCTRSLPLSGKVCRLGELSLGLQVLLERKGALLDRQARSMSRVRHGVDPGRVDPVFSKQDSYLLEQYALALSQRAQMQSLRPSESGGLQEHERQIAEVESRLLVMQGEIEAQARIATSGKPQHGGRSTTSIGNSAALAELLMRAQMLAEGQGKGKQTDDERASLVARVQERIPDNAALLEVFQFRPVELRIGQMAEHAPPRYAVRRSARRRASLR